MLRGLELNVVAVRGYEFVRPVETWSTSAGQASIQERSPRVPRSFLTVCVDLDCDKNNLVAANLVGSAAL
jgi:hypothetical protein